MERIKVALDKARLAREMAGETGQEDKRQEDKRRAEVVEPPSDEFTEPGAEQGALQALSYRSTRVITLDEEHLERNRIVAHNKNNLNSNIFDLLRTQVLNKMSENGWRTLAIVSATPEAGKSVVAINLAISIAQHAEKSALLVDFDLRRPSVAKYLGLELSLSLSDMLEGKCEMEDILVSPGIPRFVVMAAHRPIMNSSEMLASSRVQRLIGEIRERYAERIVVFDLPPLLNADDAMAVLPKIDCVLMVVANGKSSQREIEDSLRHLPTSNLLGTVFNKAQSKSQPYAYNS